MTKEQLAEMTKAFEQKGGKVEQLQEGSKHTDFVPQSLKYCNCGCYGDYTEHSMRLGESGLRR